MLSSLKKLFRPSPPNNSSRGTKLRWIEAPDNPWGIRILDCRPLTMNLTSTTSDPSIAESFVRLRSADGRAHLQAEPLPVKVSGSLSLPVPEMPPEGCLSRARQMEEKWDLFHFGNRLFVSRSWTGLLGYTAHLDCDGTSLHLSDIRSSEQHGDDHLLRELHFIFRSHGNRIIMPHPLPRVAASDDNDCDAGKERLAMHTFSRYGALGWFGSFEDTIPLREVPRDELAKWLGLPT